MSTNNIAGKASEVRFSKKVLRKTVNTVIFAKL